MYCIFHHLRTSICTWQDLYLVWNFEKNSCEENCLLFLNYFSLSEFLKVIIIPCMSSRGRKTNLSFHGNAYNFCRGQQEMPQRIFARVLFGTGTNRWNRIETRHPFLDRRSEIPETQLRDSLADSIEWNPAPRFGNTCDPQSFEWLERQMRKIHGPGLLHLCQGIPAGREILWTWNALSDGLRK